ncbi:MAG TPA: S9 family peptidase [Steroidobacteraceae bacterium]|nr:S9 family peptidase [Steroidobacteraceae bacterium]
MKHSNRLAWLLAGLLAPLVALHGAAPQRIEQGNLIFDGIPVEALNADPELPLALDSRSAAFTAWLADGSMVIATRFGNTAQLHRVRAPSGMREQLTFRLEPVTSAVAHPYDANRLLYLKDSGGNERMQIWLHDFTTGAARLLTDGNSRHGQPVFARDGKRIAFHGNARDGANNDLYLTDIDSEALPRLLLAGDSDALYVQDWSLDDRQLAVIRYRSITDSELFLLDVGTGAQVRVEPAAIPANGDSNRRRNGTAASGTARVATDGTVAVSQARFARDGRGVIFIADRGGEFHALHYYDVYTREVTTLTPDTRWDVERFELSQDGRYLAYTLNEAGFDRLVLHDLRLKADLLLPSLPAGAVITSIAFDTASRRLAVTLETAQSPQDVRVYGLDAPADATTPAAVTLTRWTHSELGPLDATRFAAAQLVQYPTWDQVGRTPRLIPAFVYRPQAPGPHPVLIDIHGGPESQHRPGWSSFRQYLVTELGFAVVAPNVRGSAGYGRSYLALDNGLLREDSVRDIGALLVWIGLQPDLDRSRVVVAGGSYGGYMALASLVHYGDRLAGGIDTVGISNFVTFLTSTADYRRDLRRAEYGDERDPQMRAHLQAISPLTNAAAIRKPLLIVQGLNDPRVPASESEQMMAMVRARGGEVWYLAAKDEGHGFRKKANSDVYRATMVAFLKQLSGQ